MSSHLRFTALGALLIASLAGCRSPMAISQRNVYIYDIDDRRMLVFEYRDRSLWPITIDGPFPYVSGNEVVILDAPSRTITEDGESWSVYDKNIRIGSRRLIGGTTVFIAEGTWRVRVEIAGKGESALERFQGEVTGRHAGPALPQVYADAYNKYYKFDLGGLLTLAENTRVATNQHETEVPVPDIVMSVVLTKYNAGGWGRQSAARKSRWCSMDTWGYVLVYAKWGGGMKAPVTIYKFSPVQRAQFIRWCRKNQIYLYP